MQENVGRPLLAWVQRHRQTTTVGSSTAGVEEAYGPCTLRIEEQGTVFKQNVAVMRDMLQEDMVSLDMVPRAAPLSAVQKADLPRVEFPFLPFAVQRLAELSTDLCGEADGHNVVSSGDHGLQKGKLLPKP